MKESDLKKRNTSSLASGGNSVDRCIAGKARCGIASEIPGAKAFAKNQSAGSAPGISITLSIECPGT